MPFPTQRVSGPNFTLPGVNFINILREAFVHKEPKSAKKYSLAVSIFCVLGICGCKSIEYMFVKLTPDEPNFVGGDFAIDVECPEACRPKDHLDWKLC